MHELLANSHVVSVLSALMGAILTMLTGFVAFKIQKRDNKLDAEIEANKKKAKSRDQLELMMAAQMLYKNYQDCVAKGYYSLEERKVYHPLYEAYINSDGNGTIKALAPIMLAMPTELPKCPKRRKSDHIEEEKA